MANFLKLFALSLLLLNLLLLTNCKTKVKQVRDNSNSNGIIEIVEVTDSIEPKSCETKRNKILDDIDILLSNRSSIERKIDTIEFKTFEFTNQAIKDYLTEVINAEDFPNNIAENPEIISEYLILSKKLKALNIEHIELTKDMIFVRLYGYEEWFYGTLCGIPFFIHKNDFPISFVKPSDKTTKVMMYADDILVCAWPTYNFVVVKDNVYSKKKWRRVVY